MARLVDNGPLGSSSLIKLSVYTEDSNDIVSFSLNMLLQIKERVLYGILKCFFESLIKIANEACPSLLDSVSAINELFLISNVNSIEDEIKIVFVLLGVSAESSFLSVNEGVKFVELLRYFSKLVVTDFIDSSVDLSLTLLEDLNLTVNGVAFFAAEVNKRI